MVEVVVYLLPFKFRRIPLSGCREVEKPKQIRGQDGHLSFCDGPENTKFGRLRVLAACLLSINYVSENSKLSQPIRDQGGHLVF